MDPVNYFIFCFLAVEERKLFIGMLSKKLNENDIRMLFAPFGTIEDCTVLRDANSQSRGGLSWGIVLCWLCKKTCTDLGCNVKQTYQWQKDSVASFMKGNSEL